MAASVTAAPPWIKALGARKAVMVSVQLGDTLLWCKMTITKWSGRGSFAILALEDSEGVVHEDKIPLPDSSIREWKGDDHCTLACLLPQLKLDETDIAAACRIQQWFRDNQTETPGSKEQDADADATAHRGGDHGGSDDCLDDRDRDDRDDEEGGGGGGGGDGGGGGGATPPAAENSDGPRHRKDRVSSIIENFQSANGQFAKYLTTKTQYCLADYNTGSGTTFLEPSAVPGPSLLASCFDRNYGIGVIGEIICMTSNILDWKAAFVEADLAGSFDDETNCRKRCVRCGCGRQRGGGYYPPLNKMEMEEYIKSGLCAFGMLENPGCRVELTLAVERGFLHDVLCVQPIDSAWLAVSDDMTPMQLESAVPLYRELQLTKIRAESRPIHTVDQIDGCKQRAYKCIGRNADRVYDTYLASKVIHSLHTEQHIALLSKECAKFFGHSFSDDHLFSVIEFKEREELLSGVPAPCRRALRAVMAEAARWRQSQRKEGGGKADIAGHVQAAREQLALVRIKSTEGDRRKEVNAWLVQEKVRPWKNMRARPGGWLWGGGLASDYIRGGETAVSFEEVKTNARALSTAQRN